MNLKESFLAMIRAMPGGWDAMAGALGMKRDALENRIYERKGQDLGVHTALQMQEFARTKQFAEAVAAVSGGTFVMLPSVDDIGNEEITDKFHEAFERLGDLSKEFREATRDGEINSRERDSLNRIVDDIHRTMDVLRALTFKVYCHETAVQQGGRKHGK